MTHTKNTATAIIAALLGLTVAGCQNEATTPPAELAPLAQIKTAGELLHECQTSLYWHQDTQTFTCLHMDIAADTELEGLDAPLA